MKNIRKRLIKINNLTINRGNVPCTNKQLKKAIEVEELPRRGQLTLIFTNRSFYIKLNSFPRKRPSSSRNYNSHKETHIERKRQQFTTCGAMGALTNFW